MAPVVLVEYDPSWPRQFEALRRIYAAALGEVAVTIEHVGSTSIPGLAAKAVLDIDVVIPDPAHLPAAIERLATLGYHHRGERGIPGRDAFGPGDGRCPTVGGPHPRHHLYVCPQGGRELTRHLAFRDWLRSHDAEARRYESLKRALAVRHADDPDAYADAKSEFVEGILAVALAH